MIFSCNCIVLLFLEDLCLKYADTARERSSSGYGDRKQIFSAISTEVVTLLNRSVLYALHID